MFEYGMSLKELKRRTSPRYYKPIKLLTEDSREYKKLSEDEKLVFMHLVRAASYFDKIDLKLKNHHGIEFLQFLKEEIAKGEVRAELTLKLFNSQKSIFSPDELGDQIELVKNIEQLNSFAFYPEDLTEEEFVKIISKMLKEGKAAEVQKILSQRSVVKRSGDELKAVDFVDAFEEFGYVARELKEAAKCCKNKQFCKFLDLQAQALLKTDPRLDAEADKVWAELDESCPFEFTITRECYGDGFTRAVLKDSELKQRLESENIEVFAKDFLGARVAIVNRRGTKLLKKLKNLITVAAKYMPYKNEYSRNMDEGEIKQTAVDVDLITLTGEEGAYRAGIVLAQNLPNDDKLSVKLGGGRRNVYHRQIRKNVNRKLFKNLINEKYFKYYNPEAEHWAVICHENTHSLGPKSHGSLGEYSSILEEYKADLGMYAFLDEFIDAGYFDEMQSRQMMVTALSGSFVKGKPVLSEAHKTREVMICNRMIIEGAISLGKNNTLMFDFEKIKKTAKTMMEEVIRLQIDRDIPAAEAYVYKWFDWSKELASVAETIKKYSKKLNGYLIEPLKDAMLCPDYEEKLKKA